MSIETKKKEKKTKSKLVEAGLAVASLIATVVIGSKKGK